MKKIIVLLLAAVMLFTAVACGGAKTNTDNTAANADNGDTGANGANGASIKVGVILVGDETEGYTLAHMNGIEKAAEVLKAEGKTVEYVYKKKVPESDAVETNAKDLIADGCTLIITNSYGHQFHFGDVISDNPNVNFVSMTGDLAAQSGLDNYVNAFTDVYESRYVSGVVAGMKLKSLIDDGTVTPEALPTAFDADGNVKIGYVGAFPYYEVVSGYTAFFLGIKSVVPNISMTVKYTNSWFSEEREAAVAEFLMSQGCVIMGQHADSTGAPAAVQKAHESGTVCYSVGYNVDMINDAPDVILTSATNNWEVYYETLFRAALDGQAIPVDWSEGYSQNAVGITELGSAVAEGTQEKVDETIQAIKDGTLHVFDITTFTVGGAQIDESTQADAIADDAFTPDTNVVSDGYFHESETRSAPYFGLRIDGITEIESDYEAE
ncbi:MAG: BMP family ABC transporter substrate-binding protein [Clostridia bacterium]|nr:BMP family ABC transporter substrate-binding protein [Clostridia bacterium]